MNNCGCSANSCNCGNNCGCSPCANICSRSSTGINQELLDSGVATIHDGLDCIREGLHQVTNNNCCRGTNLMRQGSCIVQKGLSCVKCVLNQSSLPNTEACRGVRECNEGLREIECGVCDIARGDVTDGIVLSEDGIRNIEDGVRRIENGVTTTSTYPCSCNSL